MEPAESFLFAISSWLTCWSPLCSNSSFLEIARKCRSHRKLVENNPEQTNNDRGSPVVPSNCQKWKMKSLAAITAQVSPA
jgi:hypothetical protein